MTDKLYYIGDGHNLKDITLIFKIDRTVLWKYRRLENRIGKDAFPMRRAPLWRLIFPNNMFSQCWFLPDFKIIFHAVKQCRQNSMF